MFVDTSGARIYTTLDLKLQRAASAALETKLAQIEKDHRLKNSKREFDSLATSDTTLKPSYLQGAVVALDPKDGGIRAMVGGRSLGQSYYNRAVQARRQPGSAFKVFVYTAAIDNGRSPDDIVYDEPLTLPGYEPRNIDFKFLGPIDLSTALAKSRNVAAVRLISELGPEVVVSYARRMGVRSPLHPYYSLALGSSEVTLLEMTSAFGVLANGGIRVKPRYVNKIVDRSNRIIEENVPEKEVVLSEATAQTMVSMMEGVINEGTAYTVRASGFWRPAAGKTGTTDDYADAWFVGFTPELCCGVWVGYDARRMIFRRATGGVLAAPIWTQVMRASTPPAVDGFWFSKLELPTAEVRPTLRSESLSESTAGAASSVPVAPQPLREKPESGDVEGY
ncbi:MAG: penicillin-binding transpeptidase domain-containing protein [candidate division WOR-3 bacterium]